MCPPGYHHNGIMAARELGHTMYIYIVIREINKETTFSSLQACFVMNSLFRGFINEKNIHDRYIYTIKFKIYILCIFSIIECLFSCNVIGRHEDTSSFRLFSDDSSGRQIIRNFSFRQRLHLLFELLYGKLDERMRHEMKKLMLLSLRVQMYLLSSVEFLCFA